MLFFQIFFVVDADILLILLFWCNFRTIDIIAPEDRRAEIPRGNGVRIIVVDYIVFK